MSSNARAEILRAVGEHTAADLIERLDALEQSAAPATTEATQPVQAMTAEQVREAEGQALLARLYESCPQFMPDAKPTA